MSLPADYISGTITLTNGSPNFTGTGTGWQAADFREGDILLGVEDHAGQVYVIAAITGNAAGTLTQDWAGTSGTYTYRMRYEWDSSRVSAQARAMVELLGNGNLESIAGLTGPGVVVLEGPHSAGIRPFSDFVNGVAYDVQVDTIPDRAAYDGQSAGFAVLVSDVGDGRSAVYSKASNTSGDWTDAAYITGPVGPLPEVEATVDTLPPGSAATVTPTPIAGGVRLDFELPGASGFYNAGVYDIAEAYSQDDVVRHNGSSFIALQAVPAGTSPSNAFPPTDTAHWQVLAAKGADGAGTVSSVEQGSGIAIDNTDPTAPIVSLDAALGDLKDVDLTTNPPEDGQAIIWDAASGNFVPGAGSAGASPDIEANISLLALEVADLKGSRFGMKGGVADAFDDETGINAALSTNEVYDPANDWYQPSMSAGTQVDISGFSTNGTAGSSYTYIDRTIAVLNSVTVSAIGVYSAFAGTVTVKIVRRDATGNYTVFVSEAMAHAGGGLQFHTLSAPYAVPASGTFYLAVNLPTGSQSQSVAGSRAYKLGNSPVGTETGFTEDSGSKPPLSYIHSVSTQNMTLVSVVYPSGSAPASGRLVVQINTPMTIEPNTDFDAAVSRDGGVNWTLVSFSALTSSGNVKTYESSLVSLVGQPSGSSMVFRIRTLTNKAIPVSGAVMQWGT